MSRRGGSGACSVLGDATRWVSDAHRQGTNIARYAAFMLTPDFEGDMEYAPLWAGESCGLVDDIQPAAAIVAEVVAEAKQVIARLQLSEMP